MANPVPREVLDLFTCDTATGTVIRTVARGGQPIGAIAGSTRKDGYVSVRVNRNEILIHRLIWFFHYGESPASEIDHLNGDPADNRISNLRLADRTINNQNRHGPYKNSTTGVLGVSLSPNGKFIARIRVHTKGIYLGRFDNIEDAGAAYMRARRALQIGNTL